MPGDGLVENEAILETWDAIHQWLPWGQTRPTVEDTEEKVRQFRANYIARTDLPLFMFKRSDNSFVGGGGLHRMDWSVPRFEIGYWVRRSCERQGYVSEAVRALVRLAFETLRAERAEIRCSHRNERSQRVAVRCGFILEGRLRNQSREPSGELRDTMVYSLVRGDQAVQELLRRAS
jgi:RimJ/RimL family protein N-acetyltransferase